MPCVVVGSGGSLSRALATGLGVDAVALDVLPDDADGVVVIADLDQAGQRSPVSAMSATEWCRLAEEPMRRTLSALQRSRLSMRRRGGPIVVVTPTIGIAGAADLVPLTTATEGIRAMAKSAARQWASEGISVNTIAAPVRLFDPALESSASHLSAAAVPADDMLIESVVATTRFLLESKTKHLVGQTIVVDGGSVMAP